VGSFLERVGVSKNEFTLDDGCGLSKNNAISPSGLTRVLAHNYYGPNRECFINTLSVAGVDGTLDDRFKGTTLKNRVFGKSGYVNGVSALSGYLKSKNGQWYAFAILFNHILDGSNSTMKPLQERIVKAVDDGVN
jgi:D-alanyl-D-alanine carboxypeptidase/D-alanyl-D-alanine-endopeptidase (penicillin-binding protein 4)